MERLGIPADAGSCLFSCPGGNHSGLYGIIRFEAIRNMSDETETKQGDEAVQDIHFPPQLLSTLPHYFAQSIHVSSDPEQVRLIICNRTESGGPPGEFYLYPQAVVFITPQHLIRIVKILQDQAVQLTTIMQQQLDEAKARRPADA